jgi:hypothetical protein
VLLEDRPQPRGVERAVDLLGHELHELGEP